jgi:hypothetical protein
MLSVHTHRPYTFAKSEYSRHCKYQQLKQLTAIKMTPTKTAIPIAATRITYRSSTAFETVEARLRASIQDNLKAWPNIVKTVSESSTPKETFTSLINSSVGPHGFKHFFEVDHGTWMPLFKDSLVWRPADGRNLQAKRFILGNPLIAIGMLKWDLDAGLYAPTELLLIEEENGGCRIVYQLPSGLVAGYEGATEELKKGALVLDGKLEALVVDILRD